LDTKANTALTYLWCDNNKISELDLSNNTELRILWCTDNQLTGLNISNNTNLVNLDCSNNYIQSTDKVIGWQEIALVLGDNFIFGLQKVKPLFTPGDLNDDGDIDLADLMLLRRHLAGWTDLGLNGEAADCNGDGDIDLADLMLLRRYLAGWDIKLGKQD